MARDSVDLEELDPVPAVDAVATGQVDLHILDEDASLPIAIIGMGFRGPGDATNVERLWDMILEGREAWSRIPAPKWNSDAFYHADHARHGTVNVEGGHFLTEDVSLFDAPFFNMTSDEAAAMDPQQRLLLEVTYEGLENAGIPMHKVMGSQTACFVGCFNADYTDLLLRDPERIPMYQCTNAGQSRAMTANRISYFFDMKGPSVTIDTACSGSLVALHLACQSLRTGDASMAVAAGVNVILSHEFMSTMSMMKFLSPEGRCHTFDEKANGYARGEGIGCVVLKPLRDALRDHDPVRAIIRGSGSNQDGRTAGITLPNCAAQEALIRHVYRSAGLDPADTEFVETHGTGTQAGDPIETAALGRVFSLNRQPDRPLHIGSLKTNIGHLEGTSGIAAVIKATLMLENRILAPNRNFDKLNPRILLKDWKLKIQLRPEPWESPGVHRVSVNSFGYGGSNAHVIIEETASYLAQRSLKMAHVNLDRNDSLSSDTQPRTRIFMVSGSDETSIRQQAQSLRTWLLQLKSTRSEKFLNDLAFTLGERRTLHHYRAGVVGSSITSLADALIGRLKVQSAPRRPNLGFVFTGQGAHWSGMGKELLASYPIFRKSIERIDAYLQTIGAPFHTVEEILKPKERSCLGQPLLSQPICSALQIALVDLLTSWGICPDAVTGHSSGEIAAAYASGALSMQDAMAVAYYRGVVASRLADSKVEGGMLALGMSAEEVMQHLDTIQSGKATIACVNGPRNITVSGDLSAIRELEDKLRDTVFSRRLLVQVAYHSHHMESVAAEYLRLIAHIMPRNNIQTGSSSDGRNVAFFSSVTGTEVQASYLGPQYWVRNLVSQVKFVDSVRALCFETGNKRNLPAKRTRRTGATRKINVDALVEVGPHAALSGPINQIIQGDQRLKAAELTSLTILVRGGNAVTTALSAAATLACLGYPVNLRGINNPAPSKKAQTLVNLPPYAWNHSRSYWAESRLSKVFRHRRFPRSDILGVTDPISCPSQPRWRNVLRLSEIPWLQDHKIQTNVVYPAAAYIAMAIEALGQHAQVPANEAKGCVFYLRDIAIKSALIIQENSAVETMFSLRPDEHDPSSSRTMYKFHMYSVTDDNRWTEHCTGLVGVETSGLPIECSGTEVFQHTDSSKSSTVNIRQFYAELSRAGLEYGPCFANISQSQCTGDACLACIIIPNTVSVMPMESESLYLIHPCTLDSIIHTVFANIDIRVSPAVPVYVEEISISGDISLAPGRQLTVWAETEHRTKSHLTASIRVKGRGDHIAACIRGLRCKNMNSGPTDAGTHTTRIAHRIEWRRDVDLLGPINLPTKLNENPYQEMKRDTDTTSDARALQYIINAVTQINELDHSSVSGKKAQLEFFRQVAEHKLQAAPSAKGCEMDSAEPSGPEWNLLCSIGEELSNVLQTNAESLTGMRNDLLWKAYWQEIHRRPAYQGVMEYIRLISHKDPAISILEIEAGGGGIYVKLLEQPEGDHGPPLCTKYTVTDPAPTFQTNDESVPAWADVLEFKHLDIESSTDILAFNGRRYDVVIVPHGLYTVKSKHIALQNIRKLLNPGGWLILVDTISSPTLTNSVLFSHYPAVWKEGKFGLSQRDWEEMLIQAQFSTNSHQCEFDKAVMIMARPSPEIVARSADILIVVDADSTSCGNHLKVHFLSASHAVDVTSLECASPTGKICVVLIDITKSALANPHEGAWLKIKEIFLEAKAILWVTRGGSIMPTTPEAGLVLGLARTARSESDVDPIITLDLDGRNPLRVNESALLIYNLVQNRIIENWCGPDTEYSERNGKILIPRVVEDQDINLALASAYPSQGSVFKVLYQQYPSLRAAICGNDDTLQVSFGDESQVTSHDDEIMRIKVHAINIERVAKTTTRHVETSEKISPFFECSGVVQAVGRSIRDFVPGDRIVFFSRSLRQNKVASMQKIPAYMAFDVASAIPKTYCTAMYVVRHLARVRSGDRVLVVSAATSLGRALIELCCRIGAEVMAIVEDEFEKNVLQTTSMIPHNDILISNATTYPRDLTDLAAETIDLVINCREYKSELVAPTWKCLGSSGQFLQIQRQHDLHKRRWEIPQLAKNIRFATLDFDHLIRTKPGLIDTLWASVGQLLEHGALNGLTEIASYPISKAEEVVERLESDHNVDSVAVTIALDELKTIQLNMSESLPSRGASYMLVGGLGGIGRALALWMAYRGAKTLIFVNRSGLSSKHAQEAVNELENKGVRVLVRACDVSDSQQVDSLVSKLGTEAPPIRGVIQAAMVLKDIHIKNMTLQDYLSVLQPKYSGTWNLHRYLPHTLDWFIMLSSISGIIGNATQAAYAAGSTFIDTFAAYRHALGLPAVSLDLGVITDAGYLAENTELASKLIRQGFHGTDTKTVMSLIEAAILNSEGPTEKRKAQIITGLGEWTAGQSLANFDAPLFSHFRRRFLDTTPAGAHAGASLVSLRADLQSAQTLDEAIAVVYPALGDKVAARMSIPLESIDPLGPITEYGIDSHVAVELRNWFAKSMDSTVPILEILASGSLMELAGKIANKSALVNAEREIE